MKHALYVTTAAIEVGAGLALLGFPSQAAVLLFGEPLAAPAALAIARIAGSGLLALAVACWYARSDHQSPTARGLVAAMLVYNVGAAAALSYAGIGHGLFGVLLWPGVGLHLVMGTWCVLVLGRNLPTAAK